jgi:hypothetical protein
MLINNVFFHNCDAFCKSVWNNTFSRLCGAIAPRCFTHWVTHGAFHALGGWIWTIVVGSFNKKNAQASVVQLWSLQNPYFFIVQTIVPSQSQHVDYPIVSSSNIVFAI